MGEVESADLRLQFVSADKRVVRIDARPPQRHNLGKRRRSRTGPAIAGGEVEDFHESVILTLSTTKGKDLKMRRSAATGDPSPAARLRMTAERMLHFAADGDRR